ncbi:MAG TPA: hypothetical protein VNL91_01520 [Thermoanaerobaculia bacterium]|nr:hypothetical protein [Thermoanaerobaculia bacterium]
MNDQLKNDLDRVWQLSNAVSSHEVAEALRSVVRRIQDNDE